MCDDDVAAKKTTLVRWSVGLVAGAVQTEAVLAAAATPRGVVAALQRGRLLGLQGVAGGVAAKPRDVLTNNPNVTT